MTDLATLKLQGGQIFASVKSLKEFVMDGTLPRIHNAMGDAMAKIPEGERRGAVDYGACHGLLSARASRYGFSPVLGLEYDQKSVDAFNEFVKPLMPAVTLKQARIDILSPEFEQQTVALFRSFNVNTVLARRVLSELFCTTYSKKGNGRDVEESKWRAAGKRFGEVMKTAGVEYMIIQGRAYGPYKDRATHPICNTDIEVSCVADTWREIDRTGDVSLLVPR